MAPDKSAVCSTPFGVTDVFTAGLALIPIAVGMCSTPFGVTDVFTPLDQKDKGYCWGAQRLSASLMFSLGNPESPPPQETGAQRLSASLMFSRLPLERDDARQIVLNAFRRH